MNRSDSSPQSPKAKKLKSESDEQHQTSSTAVSPDTSFNINKAIATSTPIKRPKSYIYNFIENLFKINMSEDALVDIIIDDDSDVNKVVIVGRPKLLGSSTKQMRHVTPYSFIEHAIKATIMMTKGKDDYQLYISNIKEAISPLVKSKKGVCLTGDQYNKLLSIVSSKDDVDEAFKFVTVTKEQQQHEYHLVYNDKLIEAFDKSDSFMEDIKKQAHESFQSKFAKYINYGIEYLTNDIIDPKDPNIVTITCEGLARVILTMFNQDKYAAFPQEGNSLLEEIRLYDSREHAQQANKTSLTTQKEGNWFEVKSHDEITNDVTDVKDTITKTKQEEYNLRIRIVDNEGIKVRDAADALRILNFLVFTKVTGHANKPEIKQYMDNYNNKYNLQVKMNGLDSESYNKKISVNGNLDNIFYHHVAKHLYVVFDFKPLEAKVLASKQKEKSNTIQVYPSATGIKTADYSVQDGYECRDLRYNSRQGYNDKVAFRSEMTSEEIKEVLCKRIVSHIIVSLIPFQSIKMGFELEDAQEGIRKVFKSFVNLVQKDYQNARSKGKDDIEVKLDNDWKTRIDEEYELQAKPSTVIDVSGVSKPEEGNYIQF